MKGNCLCKAVAIEAQPQKEVSVCHCGMCRRWGGGPLLCVHGGSQVRIEGIENVTTYKSSEWAERGFCSLCGTHLFYKFMQGNEYILPVGIFQEDSDFELKEQIFIDQKPSYYSFANPTENLTEAEVFAKYAPPTLE